MALGHCAATLRFYAGLNDHLPPLFRQRDMTYRFDSRATLRDGIDALGVPPADVALIVVNGNPADLERVLEDGDRVAVYPEFQSSVLIS